MPANIAITTSLYGKTSTGKVTEGGSTVVENAAGSGKTLRVSSLIVANSTASVNADLVAVVRRGGTAGAASIAFDGASNLQLTTKTGLDFSGNFTIEAWVYLVSNPSTSMILECRSNTSDANYAFGIYNQGYQRLAFFSGGAIYLSDSPIFFNRWTHVAVVRTASTVNFFVDGTRDSFSFTLAGTVTAASTTPRIGVSADGLYFAGFMEEIRVSNNARYSTATYTVPASPFTNAEANTVLLLHGDGANNGESFPDNAASGFVHTITKTNSARTSTARSVFIGDEKNIAYGVTVPANGTLVVLDKALYLEEGDRIVCLASTNERLHFVCSYEEIT